VCFLQFPAILYTSTWKYFLQNLAVVTVVGFTQQLQSIRLSNVLSKCFSYVLRIFALGPETFSICHHPNLAAPKKNNRKEPSHSSPRRLPIVSKGLPTSDPATGRQVNRRSLLSKRTGNRAHEMRASLAW